MIRVAVIGAGQWGPNLIRNFHNKQTSEVAWVIDRDEARLAEVRARFADVRVGTDAAAAFADPAVEAVVVATPTRTHHALVKAALERGKHVLVEKPITADVRQSEELAALAEGARRVLMVGHVFLYNVAVRHVKALLDSGELGRVYYVSMVRTNLGPVRADISAAREKFADDVVMSGASGGQQRCVAAFIRSVDVGTVVEQPADDFEAAVCRSDVEAYGSVRIEFRSVLEQLFGNVEAAAFECGVEDVRLDHPDPFDGLGSRRV